MAADGRLQDLIQGLQRRPSVDENEVEQVVSALGWRVPSDYVSFLASSNGAEGPVGRDGYLILWPVEELEAMNTAYHVMDFAPDLAIFGTDGGDTAYAFHKRSGEVVAVPFIGLSSKEAEVLGTTFEGFLFRISADG
jgi:SMI1 / KNR4 family (SUKH-1)